MGFNKGAYDKQYAKEHIKRKHIPFNDTDPEDMRLLAWINRQPNATEYVKKLVREDMEKAGVINAQRVDH